MGKANDSRQRERRVRTSIDYCSEVSLSRRNILHNYADFCSIFLSKTQEYDKTLSDLQDQLTTLEASKVTIIYI